MYIHVLYYTYAYTVVLVQLYVYIYDNMYSSTYDSYVPHVYSCTLYELVLVPYIHVHHVQLYYELYRRAQVVVNVCVCFP